MTERKRAQKNESPKPETEAGNSTTKQQFFWVSYSEEKPERKNNEAAQDNILEQSNRFAL